MLRTRLSLLASVAATSLGLMLLVLTAAPLAAAEGPPFGQMYVSPTTVEWDPQIEYADLTVTIVDECEDPHEQVFRAGDKPFFSLYDAKGNKHPDGPYTIELRSRPVVDRAVQGILEEIYQSGSFKDRRALLKSGLLPEAGLADTYSVRIDKGAFVDPELQERSQPKATLAERAGAAAPRAAGPVLATKDFVILDDLIVDGSACIGFDCVNGESFGFDTIRLKENNLRIKFDDTSTAASYPRNDWQLTANASANGGASKFSIDDISGGRTPFTVEANAPSNSLYVDDGGRLGLGTSTPSTEIHIVDGDTATLRLAQDSSSGFAPQTWDVAGNETSFFIRDATNGSTLPFRIRPGAPSSSLAIDADGNVGLGTFAPSEDLHLTGSDGTTKFLVTETNGTAETRQLLELTNNGGVRFDLTNTADDNWRLANLTAGFQIIRGGSGVTEFLLEDDGDLVIAGTLTENSDRNTKHQIFPVEPGDVLSKVRQLPIATWVRKTDESGAMHMGPMAQDFAAAFGLGDSDRKISTVDVGGVSLAAIQGLTELVDEKDQRIQALETQNTEMSERLAALEALVQQLIRN